MSHQPPALPRRYGSSFPKGVGKADGRRGFRRFTARSQRRATRGTAGALRHARSTLAHLSYGSTLQRSRRAAIRTGLPGSPTAASHSSRALLRGAAIVRYNEAPLLLCLSRDRLAGPPRPSSRL
ncbi:hypothetical protein AAFF_G00394370 [Aldrovandia affinis]|uniref:Uncharacterized protein n=1 Tax=Aldrovandia affinis TaxID=143900 RepID=A0AAD7SE42_9TELE|nr:hypothetical protein AAFF_G00394370 [Aldrovandia affinis]